MRLFKAEYVYRPSQLIRRFAARAGFASAVAELPWGQSLRVSPRSDIGQQISVLGVFDLIVTETLWRLCDAGDLAVDVGANIGYMTAALARCVGPAGMVISFEPHPTIYKELLANVPLLAVSRNGRVHARQAAVGASRSVMQLHVPEDLERHPGESSLRRLDHLKESSQQISVEVWALDDELPDDARIGVMKLDVEGFELEVLKGARRLFCEGRVRDCVFEEHHEVPSDVTNWFTDCGYSVFRLHRGILRPKLLPLDSTEPRSTWESTSFVATKDPDRALNRFKGTGWRCLSAK